MPGSRLTLHHNSNLLLLSCYKLQLAIYQSQPRESHCHCFNLMDIPLFDDVGMSLISCSTVYVAVNVVIAEVVVSSKSTEVVLVVPSLVESKTLSRQVAPTCIYIQGNMYFYY